jgi:hypothetical protein
MTAFPAQKGMILDVRPELGLTLALSRWPMSPEMVEMAATLLSRPLDWDQFFSTARIGEVEPAVMNNLINLFPDRIPADVLSAATHRERESRATAVAKTLVLAELVRALREDSVFVVVLKGAALAYEAYGDPSMRTSADIDLLAEPVDLPRIESVLGAKGYQPLFDPHNALSLIRAGHALEYSGPLAKVEIHTELFPKHLRVKFDSSAILQAPSFMAVNGFEIGIPSRPVHFVLACAHAAKHEWASLRLICDAAQMIDKMTTEEALEAVRVARHAKVAGFLIIGVTLAHEILGVEPGAFARTLHDRSSRTQALVRVILDRLRGQPQSGIIGWLAKRDPWLSPLLFWVRGRDRFVDKVGCIVHAAFFPNNSLTDLSPNNLLRRLVQRGSPSR